MLRRTVQLVRGARHGGMILLLDVPKEEDATRIECLLKLPIRPGRARTPVAERRERVPDDIENVGTRHRAAYRFVNDCARSLAIVASHDGRLSFVANRDEEFVFW